MPARRKLATVLSCDVTGSTALGERMDPESVRDAMLRYFHTMRTALERHGGTVEKFIGDAVVAVFGVPVAHEDDALRACRAANEMRDRMDELNDELERALGVRLSVRIGLATGEVVAGDASTRETFVTGDAANVAARLQAAAAPGEIVVSEATAALAGGGVEVEPLPPVVAKGKSEPVPAFRLTAVESAPSVRASQAAFVGREAEVEELLSRLDVAGAEERCVVATVVGEPGVGKTRVVAEATGRVAGRADVYVGRCLSYGEGITYWPLAEIVRAAARIYDEDSPDAARAKIDAICGRVVGERVGAALGLPGSAAGSGEIAWAFRKLFEAFAERPLLLVVEDVHWADETLLDLLAAMERAAAPIVVLLTARPELLEERPDWPVAVRLEPLGDFELNRLAGELGDVDERLVRLSGGNPLFLEELHAFTREHPDEQTLPPTLSALLAARLDRLPEAERICAERASVEGEHFHRGGVAALEGDTAHLTALVARDLIRPTRAEFVGEAAYRFKHALVRDAAYNAMAKKLRAELHERFAGWLEPTAGDRVTEYEEILGYHLERAFHYREELRPTDDTARDLARRAGEWLAAAGLRAARRADTPTSISLLERAEALLPLGHARLAEALVKLGSCLIVGGREQATLRAVWTKAGDAARAAGRADLEQCALVHLRELDPEPPSADEIDRAIAAAGNDASDDALALLMFRAGVRHAREGTPYAGIEALLDRGFHHAMQAGDEQLAGLILGWLCVTWNQGPTPYPEVARRIDGLAEVTSGRPALEAPRLLQLARTNANLGRIDEARGLAARGRAIREDLGERYMLAAGAMQAQGAVEAANDDWAKAVEIWKESYGLLREMNDYGFAGARAGTIAYGAYRLERLDEAERFARLGEEAGQTPEVRALLLARAGRHEEAEALARTFLWDVKRDDAPSARSDALVLLGEVMVLAGRRSKAVPLAEEAVALAEAKGSAWGMRIAQELLTACAAPVTRE